MRAWLRVSFKKVVFFFHFWFLKHLHSIIPEIHIEGQRRWVKEDLSITNYADLLQIVWHSSFCKDGAIPKYIDENACRSDVDFKEFCLQVLFECVSKDRPALLQVI